MAPPTLTLASTSSYRQSLLSRLGLRFETADPAVCEDALPGENVDQMVRRLSLAKAAACLSGANLCIGSDQSAELDGRLLTKPGSMARARDQLAAASGRTVRFVTGVCVASAERHQVCLDITEVTFRALGADEIDRYVAQEQPLDCAGSFKVEGLGISLFERIESQDPSALQGLPLIALCRMLRQFGVEVP